MSRPDHPWYNEGLAFICQGCGNCCSGPNEGYVWVDDVEMEAIAKYLHIPLDQLKKTMIRKIDNGYSLIEKEPSKDCIFLSWPTNGQKGCEIYPVRPMQCRTWPFWQENLKNKKTWEKAGRACPGINQGNLYHSEQIQSILNSNSKGDCDNPIDMEHCVLWIRSHLDWDNADASLEQIYHFIYERLSTQGNQCENCGSCCHFKAYGHKLYVTTVEVLFFLRHINNDNNWLLDNLSPLKCPAGCADGCREYDHRPAGCRIFYCQSISNDYQYELTEQVLRNLRQLHNELDAPYLYADWMAWLGAIRSKISGG